jgi:hypothetical protein
MEAISTTHRSAYLMRKNKRIRRISRIGNAKRVQAESWKIEMKLTVHATIIARKGEMALALHILNGLDGLKSSGLDKLRMTALIKDAAGGEAFKQSVACIHRVCRSRTNSIHQDVLWPPHDNSALCARTKMRPLFSSEEICVSNLLEEFQNFYRPAFEFQVEADGNETKIAER